MSNDEHQRYATIKDHPLVARLRTERDEGASVRDRLLERHEDLHLSSGGTLDEAMETTPWFRAGVVLEQLLAVAACYEDQQAVLARSAVFALEVTEARRALTRLVEAGHLAMGDHGHSPGWPEAMTAARAVLQRSGSAEIHSDISMYECPTKTRRTDGWQCNCAGRPALSPASLAGALEPLVRAVVDAWQAALGDAEDEWQSQAGARPNDCCASDQAWG